MPRRRVPPTQITDAVDRITNRRTTAGDPDLHRLGDHPEDVVRHVHQHRRVPDHVLHDDVRDALLICDALTALIDVHRLRLIDAGRAAGMSLQDLAEPLGQRNRQGVLELIRRLQGAAAGGTKSAAAVYAARRADREQRRRAHTAADTARHLARHLVAAADRLPAATADEIHEIRDLLRRDRQGEDVSAVLAARLRLLLAELVDVDLDEDLRTAISDAAPALRPTR